jgi:hypothetical protein
MSNIRKTPSDNFLRGANIFVINIHHNDISTISWKHDCEGKEPTGLIWHTSLFMYYTDRKMTTCVYLENICFRKWITVPYVRPN